MYAIAVYASHVAWPIGCLAWHSWIVITIDGLSNRYDILHDTLDGVQWFSPIWGHLHINTTHTTQWMLRWRSKGKPRPSHLLYHKKLKKSDHQELKILVAYITSYPYRNTYHFCWPNSNSFTQRAIDKSPLINYTLPSKAYGRFYHRRKTRVLCNHTQTL